MDSPVENLQNIPISPNKSELESDSFEEINSNLLKIIEKNGEKINSISLYINISELLGLFSFFVFLLVLTVKLSNLEEFKFAFSYILIPSLISLISFTFELNLYLKLKDLLTEGITLEDREKSSSSLGSILSYFCLNTGSICLSIYLILLALKLDNFLSINFNETAVPLYMLMGILMFYYIFIFPAFLKNKLMPELFLIGLYLIASFIFFLLTNLKFDTESSIQFCYISLALLSVMVLNIIYFIYSIVSNRNEMVNNVTNLITILLSFSSSIMICLKLDKIILMENWIPLSLIIFSYLIFVSDKIFMLFELKNTNNNLEENITSNSNDTDEKEH